MSGAFAGVTSALLPTAARWLAAEQRRLGVPEPGKAAAAAALAASHDGPTLLAAATPARAQALYHELLLFSTGFPVARLPEREALPYELAYDDEVAAAERARALALLREDGAALVVASWPALALHLAGPEVSSAGIDVRVGERGDPAGLVARLEALSYAVDYVADRPGMAARRGGIVDVYPAGGETPLRIEFFGDEVDSIRVLDLASQRSLNRTDHVHLPPAGTGTSHARAAARALADSLTVDSDEADRLLEQLELVAEGNRTSHATLVEALLHDATALDHLAKGGLVLLDEADEGLASLEQAWEHERHTQEELERRQTIPGGLPPLMATPEALRAALHARHPLQFERFGVAELGVIEAQMAVPPSFGGQLKPFVDQVMALAADDRAVVVASQQALRIADLVEDAGGEHRLTRELTEAPEPGEIVLLPVAAAAGFIFDERLVLISDHEIFGFRKRHRPSRMRQTLSRELVSRLEPGDYLVHIDHGIARFAGLLHRTIDDIEREYLELQYAEGDRLFVPTDQLHLVGPYIGPSDHPPSLTRLGTQEWTSAKRRVRHAVAEIAQELLELYAQRAAAQGHAYPPDTAWQMEMEAAFPFIETEDQLRAIAEVKHDMESPQPMDRLICGDVGFGKTEVAMRAAFKAVMDGKQVAVLVPTTVLAEQHGASFRERMAGFPVRVEVLSRFRSPEQQRAIVRGVGDGTVDVVVGTHRILSKDVQFHDLGLVVIDEEQRFGVDQKEKLTAVRAEVDVLSMSATPIPRTLQMALSGIREMSTVMTPPEERLPIRTYVTEWDDQIIREAILREIERGGQAYFVHNRIYNIQGIVRRLQELVPEASFIIGHGQMPEEQLERVMAEFAAGEHTVLVCTTIIESGLDLPNVNTILIHQADMMGLAQLYQLRGRVGRGAHRSYAYLIHGRNKQVSEVAQKRLEAVFEATDLGAGFQIALRDLEIRGAGNVLGTAQSGHIASVGFDLYARLLGEAVEAIKRVAAPEVAADQPPELPRPVPQVELPMSAHIPVTYIADMHARLAVYQRIAEIEALDAVPEMEAELRDRFGPVPPSVEHLLSLALVKVLAREAGVENITTDEDLIHIYVRNGTTAGQRRRVEAMGLRHVLPGPKQVRIDRVGAGDEWLPLVIRILRSLAARPSAKPAEELEAATVSG